MEAAAEGESALKAMARNEGILCISSEFQVHYLPIPFFTVHINSLYFVNTALPHHPFLFTTRSPPTSASTPLPPPCHSQRRHAVMDAHAPVPAPAVGLSPIHHS